jgi:hypothetical protein
MEGHCGARVEAGGSGPKVVDVTQELGEQPAGEVPEVASSAVPSEEASRGAGAHAAPRRGALGVWAFVLSLLGLIGLLPIIGSVLGFVLGRVAVRQADTRSLIGGRGRAVAAATISVITLVVIALGVATYALVVAYLEI